MDHQEDKVVQVETELVEDLELTNQQAGETTAGSKSDKLQTYMEIKLTDAMIS